MPRDSAWRTSPTRRSQVSAGARPGQAAALGGHTAPGPPGPLLLPPVAELLVFTFRQGSPGRRAVRRMLPRRPPRGKVCVSAASLCAHAGAPFCPPSLRSRALAPPSLLAPAGRAGEPGTLGGGRGARADRRAGRPARAPSLGQSWKNCGRSLPKRHSLSGAFSTPALAPAGAAERRRGLPSPLAPLSLSFGEAERSAPGLGAGEAGGGTPTRDPASRRR